MYVFFFSEIEENCFSKKVYFYQEIKDHLRRTPVLTNMIVKDTKPPVFMEPHLNITKVRPKATRKMTYKLIRHYE